MKRAATCPVLLWWGCELRLGLGGRELIRRTLAAGEDPVRGLAQLAQSACPDARRLRLIYQPDTLDPHDVLCPQMGRARLRRFLSAEFHALAAPGTVWAAETIRVGRDGEGTRLHLDPASRLPALVAALAVHRQRLEGAWSLLSLIETAAVSGAVRDGLHLVATEQRALVLCHPPAGERWVRFLEGADCWGSALAALRGAQAQFEVRERIGGSAIVDAGSAPEGWHEALAEFGLTAANLEDLLAVAHALPPDGLGDFLARPPVYARRPAQAVAAAACGLALLGAGGLHLRSVREHREQRRRELTDERDRHRRDETAAADRQAREQQAAAIDRALARLQTEVPRQAELLVAITRALPSRLVLKRIATDATAFTLTGASCAPASGTGEPDAEHFRRDLAAAGDAWQLEPVSAGPAGGDFLLRGHFRSTAPAVEAALPDAAAFAAQWPALTHPWRIETGITDHFPGFEVRRYRLEAVDRQAGAWPALLAAVAALCRLPGLTIGRFAFVAEPGGTGVLRQAELSVEIRLRL